MKMPEPIDSFISNLNQWGTTGTPFFFLIDFEMKKPVALPLDRIDPLAICYAINGQSNVADRRQSLEEIQMNKFPIDRHEYAVRFNKVYHHLHRGDSYLTNLTIKTRIELPNLSLHRLFELSDARYKLIYNNEFLVFSPEPFIRIQYNKIFSYPMKGTIDASLPNAKEILLNDAKELAEHVTIVDLIRNDLSGKAENVSVNKFRYVEEVNTHDKKLLQVSSEICGELPVDYHQHLGDLMVSLLPAGSVSGAPKRATCDIIREAEGEDRGYYTGVFGIFNGETVDSGVMIRFIEKENDQLYYRSGGGITVRSEMTKEYEEAIAKVYVPVV